MMSTKLKSIIVFVVAAACAGCFFLPTGVQKVAGYLPRGEQMEQSTFLNSVEYLKKLRGNVETGEFDQVMWGQVYGSAMDYNRTHGATRDVELNWFEMGPDNVGGRTRAILAVDNNLIYAGGATGGLWRSTDAGNTWTQVTSFPHCSIGSIDQTGDGTIFVGTGSVFDGYGGDTGSSSMGNGLYYSTDNGDTWTTVPGTATTPFVTSEDWVFVNDLAADPNNGSRIWIAGSAGVGYWDVGSSDDPTMAPGTLPNNQGQDIEWAVDGSYMLIAMGSAKIYKGNAAGDDFSLLQTGVTSSGRARVAISTLDPNQCYVLYSGGNGLFDGLYHSSNKGDSWSEIWPPGNDTWGTILENGQGFYDLALIVDPCDAQNCFLGGITLWEKGAGSTAQQIAFNFTFEGADDYVHSDIHTMELAPNGDVYIGTDGGVFKTTDCGNSFISCNRGYNVTQFYGIAHTAGYPAMGGTQDNGTIFLPGLGNPFVNVTTQQQGIEVGGGDGFDCDISQITEGNHAMLFQSSYYGVVNRFNETGAGGLFYDDEINDLVNPDAPLGLGIGIFYTPLRLFEDTEDEDSQQYIYFENPYDEDISDSTFTVYTLNHNLPFEWEMPEGLTLHYWEELERPAFSDSILYENDPNYFWLDAQFIDSTWQACDSILDGYDTTFFDIPITETVYWYDTLYFEGDTIPVMDSTIVVVGYEQDTLVTPDYDPINCVTWYHYAADVVLDVHEQIMIQDTYTSLFVTAFTGSDGLWITRQALNTSVTPDWWRISNAPADGVKAFEFTHDGNTLFYSSWGGQLWRISGLDNLYSAEDVANLEIKQIYTNAGSLISGIASDPNDPNHLVITLAGFGTLTGGKVRECWNALDEDIATSDFSNIWFSSGDLAKMPCYDVIINVMDDDGYTVVVGTEFGVYATDDGGDTWLHQNGQATGSTGTINTCPVFALRQQQFGARRYSYPDNYGRIYAGTHGRGIFLTDEYTGVDELLADTESQNSLLIYPNPSRDEAFVDIDLSSATRIHLNVMDMRGKLVRSLDKGQLAPGRHKLDLEIARLAPGNYVIQLDAGKASGIGKLLKVE